MEEFIVKLEEGKPFLFEEIKTEMPVFFENEDPQFSTSYLKLGKISADSTYSLDKRYSARDITKIGETTLYGSGKKPIITAEYKIDKKENEART